MNLHKYHKVFALSALLMPLATFGEGVATSNENIVAAVDPSVEGIKPRCLTMREGWFAEAGLDMTLYNVYNRDFSDAFSKGRTQGLTIGIGKRFSPEVALRVRANWENGLSFMGNPKLEWISPIDPSTQLSTNVDHGGCLFTYLDVMVSLSALFGSRDRQRAWDILFIPRAGVGSNRGFNSWSPLVGMGMGYTHRISHRLKVYADLTYSGITSEFISGDNSQGTGIPDTTTGMFTSTGFNGIMSLHAGLQIDLNKK